MPVGKVKRLRPEFKPHALVNRELLKERHIEILETGTSCLGRFAAEWRVVGLPNRGCNRRIRKRARIEPLVNVVRAGVDVLPRDYVRQSIRNPRWLEWDTQA